MTRFLFGEPAAPWHEWNAWHPIYTEDKGWLWRWPWKREVILRRAITVPPSGLPSDEIPAYEYRVFVSSPLRHP